MATRIVRDRIRRQDSGTSISTQQCRLVSKYPHSILLLLLSLLFCCCHFPSSSGFAHTGRSSSEIDEKLSHFESPLIEKYLHPTSGGASSKRIVNFSELPVSLKSGKAPASEIHFSNSQLQSTADENNKRHSKTFSIEDRRDGRRGRQYSRDEDGQHEHRRASSSSLDVNSDVSSAASSNGPILAPVNFRLSKLGAEFDSHSASSSVQHPVSSRANPDSPMMSLQPKANGGGNGKPGGMDDLLGGLLQLMGGNLKMQPNGQPQLPPGMPADLNKKLMANLLANFNNNNNNNHNNNRQPQASNNRFGQQTPFQRPFNGGPVNGNGNGQHFPMYQNMPFMPAMMAAGQQRPQPHSIPLNNGANGALNSNRDNNNNNPLLLPPKLPPKLPPNLPPINGLSKPEMDALYAQFVSSHNSNNNNNGQPLQNPKNQAALMQNLLKLTGGKPLPPGLFPPGVFAPAHQLLKPSLSSSRSGPPSTAMLAPSSTVTSSGDFSTPSSSLTLSSQVASSVSSVYSRPSASFSASRKPTITQSAGHYQPVVPRPSSASSISASKVLSSSVRSVQNSQWQSFGQFDTSIIRPSVITSVYKSPQSGVISSQPDIITLPDEPSVFEMVVKHTIGPNGNEQKTIFKTTSPASSQAPSQFDFPASAVVDDTPATDIRPTRTFPSHSHQRPTATVPTTNNNNNIPNLNRPMVKFNTKPEDVTVQKPHEAAPQAGDVSSASIPTSPSTSSSSSRHVKTTDVVYGKRVTTKPTLASSIEPSFVPTSTYSPRSTPVAATSSPQLLSSTIAHGQPMVTPMEVNEVVKPKVAGQSSSSSQSKPKPAKSHGRRPPFRPRPNVPIVRIDTCIVGDDSTCDVNLNEKCLTELGLSSCQCRPGFARFVPRTPCIPILAISFSMRLDKMNEKKVLFTRGLLNSNSEEYQYLEYETVAAINSLFAVTKSLAEEFMGVRINRFYSISGRTIVNATINLRAESNDTIPTPSRLALPGVSKRAIQQELSQAIVASGNQLGESALWVDSPSNAISRVEDINECSSSELNDCSKHAKCFNEFGTYRCQCLMGYEDRSPEEKHRAGRQCSSCSPSYCSNRGECLIVDGEKTCKCRGNFIGTQCEIDAEVLGVAVGGSIAALIIIVITFICLYMWNQRFKAEQAKIEAMSAASGHTFSYVTKHGHHTLSRMGDGRDHERYGAHRGTWNFSDSQTHLLRTSPTHRDSSPYGITTSDGSSPHNLHQAPQQHHHSQPHHSGHHHHASHHQTSVYATPVRVLNNSTSNRREQPATTEYEADIPYPDYAGAPAPPRSQAGFRSLKSNKQSHSNHSRTGHYPNFTMKHAPESYKETEFYSTGQYYSGHQSSPTSNGGGPNTAGAGNGGASNLYSSSHGYY